MHASRSETNINVRAVRGRRFHSGRLFILVTLHVTLAKLNAASYSLLVRIHTVPVTSHRVAFHSLQHSESYEIALACFAGTCSSDASATPGLASVTHKLQAHMSLSRAQKT